MKQVLYEGPDISKHNGVVDVKRIREAGYKRIGIRCGYGKNNIDQKYIANALACVNFGVPVVLYWFSYAFNTAMAAAEARYAVEQAKKYWKKCPIAFDFEYESVNYARKNGVHITKKSATDMAVAFLKEVVAAGYIPVIYTNRDYILNYFEMDRITKEVGKVYLWYARYTSRLSASEVNEADIWQYTSKKRIPGTSGNTDMNKFYTNFETVAETPEENTRCNINILDFQRAANADGCRDANGKLLKEDGIDGSKTQYVRKRINLYAKRSGTSWKVGCSGNVVKWWQRRCNEILGCNRKVDGLFGKDTRATTIQVQKKLNLLADGIAGYNSIQAAFYN